MRKPKRAFIAIIPALCILGLLFPKGAIGEDPDKKYYVECFDTGMSGNHICYEYADDMFFEACTAEQLQTAVPSWYCPHTAEWSQNPLAPIIGQD